MTRKEFLTELDRRLEVLPKSEIDDHLAYYAEILADRVEDGMTDEEAVASLESLDTIAARILGRHYTEANAKRTDRRVAIICIGAIAAMVCMIAGILALVATNVGTEIVEVNTPIVSETIPMDTPCITLPADEIRNIRIDWISNSVSLSVWDEDEILLETYGYYLPEYDIAGDTLEIGGQLDSAALHVILPRTLAEHQLEELTISVSSANVELFGIHAERLDLSTISGICTVDGSFGEADISTSSGHISFIGTFEVGYFDTISGDIDISADSALTSLEIDSSSGHAALTLPAEVGFSLEFSSASGRLFTDDRGSFSGDAAFTHGSGRAEINVDTISGDMSLYLY